MKKTWFWLTFFCFTLSFQNCGKDEIRIQNSSEFEAYLADEMENQHIPALAILIFKENEIVFEKYLGEADLAQQTPLQENDLFLMASVSKVVTATALLQLHEEGQFSLDEPINDYLPFNVSVPGYDTPITFRMLLTHTSGIADGSALDGQYYYGTDSPVALDYFLENYLVPGGMYYDPDENFYDFKPGTDHEYSNEGSALLAVLIEQISHQDFNSYCKANIFQPLGMSHTFWKLEEAFQANATIARPYNFVNNKNEVVEHYTFTDYPNGGLRTTARDLHRFLRAFVMDGMSNNYRLLQAETIRSMLTPQIPAINPEVGLHMFLMNSAYSLWGHDGGEDGVATIMAFNPETKVGAIILTNQGEADLDPLLEESYQFGLKQ